MNARVNSPKPTREQLERLGEALGSRVRDRVPTQGGYSPALRAIAHLADGRRFFVKISTNPFTRKALRAEKEVYEGLSGSFILRHVAWIEDEDPVLVLPDLSDARRVPPWSPSLPPLQWLCGYASGTVVQLHKTKKALFCCDPGSPSSPSHSRPAPRSTRSKKSILSQPATSHVVWA